MSDSYYKAPDLDALFPKEVPAVTTVPSRDPEASKRASEALHAAIGQINNELGRIRAGTSHLIPNAIAFTPEKTPFCLILKLMGTETAREEFDVVSAKKHIDQVVKMARQDFGETFSNFVASEINKVFEVK